MGLSELTSRRGRSPGSRKPGAPEGLPPTLSCPSLPQGPQPGRREEATSLTAPGETSGGPSGGGVSGDLPQRHPSPELQVVRVPKGNRGCWLTLEAHRRGLEGGVSARCCLRLLANQELRPP